MTIRRIVAALGVALLLSMPASASGVRLTPVEAAFLREINSTRAAHGLRPVTLQVNLVIAARYHSRDMVKHGFFAHGDFAGRLQRFGVEPGLVGEDLGWDARVGSAVPHLLAAWLKSRPHRDVLLNPRYRTVGIGVTTGPFAGHSRALVVTADFHGP
jgi:uncharacterized protein YkwD